MHLLRRSGTADATLLALLTQSGDNVERVSVLLRDLLIDYPEHAEIVSDVRRCEHEGDRIAREIIHRLRSNGHSRLPFQRG